MAFARDRDLLALEPNLLREVRWRGQVMVEASDASLAGTALVSAASDFEAAGVDAGAVALVGEVAVEVIERVSATELVVSRVRPRVDDPPAPSAAQGVDLSLIVPTFGPQIERVHADLLRRVGLEAEQIFNGEDFRFVEAVGALQLVYEAAAVGCDAAAQGVKRARYARQFDAARLRLVALADLDGDGVVDAHRAAGMTAPGRV